MDVDVKKPMKWNGTRPYHRERTPPQLAFIMNDGVAVIRWMNSGREFFEAWERMRDEIENVPGPKRTLKVWLVEGDGMGLWNAGLWVTSDQEPKQGMKVIGGPYLLVEGEAS